MESVSIMSHEELQDEVTRLRIAIQKVVTQRADDLCWRDAYVELAGLVGITFCPDLIAEPEQMLANCCAFVHSLRTGGKYNPVFVEKQMDKNTDIQFMDRNALKAEVLRLRKIIDTGLLLVERALDFSYKCSLKASSRKNKKAG